MNINKEYEWAFFSFLHLLLRWLAEAYSLEAVILVGVNSCGKCSGCVCEEGQ